MNQEYKVGYTQGKINGENDSNIYVSPYPFTEGTEAYKQGYKNGYLKQYRQRLSSKLKSTFNSELEKIINNNLNELNEYIKMEGKQK